MLTSVINKVIDMYDKYQSDKLEIERAVLRVMEQEAYIETIKLRRAQVGKLCRHKVSDLDLEKEDCVLSALYHERDWFANRCEELESKLKGEGLWIG